MPKRADRKLGPVARVDAFMVRMLAAQMNGSDCGVFTTRTADYLSRDAVLDFTQADMAYFRRRMVIELLDTQLLP